MTRFFTSSGHKNQQSGHTDLSSSRTQRLPPGPMAECSPDLKRFQKWSLKTLQSSLFLVEKFKQYPNYKFGGILYLWLRNWCPNWPPPYPRLLASHGLGFPTRLALRRSLNGEKTSMKFNTLLSKFYDYVCLWMLQRFKFGIFS